MARRAAASLALALLAGCIPSRDNPHDPAVAAKPVFSVRVDGIETANGSRGQRWELDGSGSEGRNGGDAADDTCRWSISTRAEPGPADWTPIAEAACAETVVLTPALAGIEDFSNGDGTGTTARRVRLELSGVTAERLLQIVNDAPIVSLGPDRRTSPGGRWWTNPVQAFEVEIEAYVDDPDSDLLVFDWYVTGALAATIGSNGGPRVHPDFIVDGGRKVRFDQLLDPSRSRLTVQVRDGDFEAFGEDTVRADVLTTLWLFNEGNGHLRRMDTSQFVSSVFASQDRALAVDGERILAARFDLGSSEVRYYVTDRGFRPDPGLAEVDPAVPESALASVAASPDGAGGWWVLAGGVGQLSHLIEVGAGYVADLDRSRLDGLSTPPNSSDFLVGNDAVAVRGLGTDIWVTASPGFDPKVVRMSTAGVSTAFDAVYDEAGTFYRVPDAMTSDGAGGVWFGAEEYLVHVTAAGVRTQNVLPIECGTDDAKIEALAYDDDRDVLWIGASDSVFGGGGGGGLGGALCRTQNLFAQNATVQSQLVDTIGPIVIDETDGTALMAANDGTGVSRYDAFDASSTDYVPVNNPAYEILDLLTLDGQSFVTSVRNRTDPNELRLMMMEAGEIFAPQNVELGVDPYEFDNVRHVVDPTTGFAWVFHPDDLVVRGYSPDGQLLVGTNGEPLQATISGTGPHRGFLAFDADARRIWLTSYPYLEEDGAPGALWSIDLPASATAAISATSAAGIAVTRARGLDVVPSNSPSSAAGRVCIAGNFGDHPGDPFTLSLGRAYDPGTGVITSVANSLVRNLGTDDEMQAVASPISGDCFFAPQGFDTVGFLRANDTLDETNGVNFFEGRTVFGPDGNGGARLLAAEPGFVDWSVSGPADFTSIYTPSPELRTFTQNQTGSSIRSLAIDPYYGHVWVGFGDTTGNVNGVTRFVLLDHPGFTDPAAVIWSELQTDRQAIGAHVESGF